MVICAGHCSVTGCECTGTSWAPWWCSTSPPYSTLSHTYTLLTTAISIKSGTRSRSGCNLYISKDVTLYSRLGHAHCTMCIAHAQYPWTEYILPRIKYVLLIWDTMITVRKFNEFDSIVLLAYFCIKIYNWQNANLLLTNFASFEPLLQKQFFLTVRERWKQKPFFSSNKCCCTKNIKISCKNLVQRTQIEIRIWVIWQSDPDLYPVKILCKRQTIRLQLRLQENVAVPTPARLCNTGKKAFYINVFEVLLFRTFKTRKSYRYTDIESILKALHKHCLGNIKIRRKKCCFIT
jgi:hypothetical protein